mgnify:CR=1 FL=1
MATSSLTEVLRETLALFEDSGEPRTTTEVANRLDLGRRSTYERLERLVEHGRLETKKVGGNGRVWWQPPTNGDAAPDWSAAAESLIDDVLDSAEVGIFVLDEDFDVAWINDATERYFGLDRKRVLGRDKRQLVEAEIASVVDEGEVFTETVQATYDDNTYTERFECRVTPDEDRQERWLEHRSKPIQAGAYAGGRVELYYDITDRKQVKRAHDRDRTQFESIIDAVEEYAIFMLDPEGYVQTWNQGAERIKGYAAEEIIGEHFSRFYTDEAREAGAPGESLAAATEHGSVEDEGWRLRADGSRFWANVTLTAVRGDDGELDGYVKVTHDMTERREHEQKIRQERNLLEQVQEASPIGIGIFDAEGELYRANRRFTELLGWNDVDPLDYSLGQQPLLDAGGDVIPYPERPAPRALSTGESVIDKRVRIDGPDGRTRWLSVNAKPFDGETDGVVVTMADVTQLKEQAQRLERQRDDLENELAEVFDRIDDGFFSLDSDLRFTYVNEQASALLGTASSELVGEYIWDALEPGPKAEAAFNAALETQESVSFEEQYEPLETCFESHVYPSEDGLSVYFTDITERKQFEDTLLTLYESAQTLLDAETAEAVDEMVVEAVADVIDLPGVAVYRYDDAADELYPAAQSVEDGFISDGELPAVPPDDSSLTGHVYVSGDVHSFSDISESPYLQANETEMHSGLFVPMDDHGVLITGTPGVGGIDDNTRRLVELLATNAEAAYNRVERDVALRKRERELEQQREYLAALNNLNEVVHDITEAVIEQSTREEIEQTVCERLADSESYLFAWIGDVDTTSQTVNLREEAGVEGYLDGISISVDPDDERSDGPTGRALRTGEPQVSHDIRAESRYDPWRQHIEQYGFRSSAAIPIVHEGTTYGVINVYADRPYAFDGPERAVITQLGEVVGHAIAASERKQALMSDELVELEFQIRDVFTALDIPGEADGLITLDNAVPVGDDEFLVYGTTAPDVVDTVGEITENLPHWQDLTIRSEGDPTHFEVRMTEPPVLSVVASLGGYVEQAVIEDGDCQMTIHLAPSVDARRVTDAVETAYPTAEMLRHRQISRNRDDPTYFQRHLVEDLTDRQQTALETAYHAGFFEWPRDTSGEEVAESIGVAPPTFHQHLRKAERKVFDAVFSSPNQRVG